MALKPKKRKIQLDMVCGGRASGFAGAVIVGVLNGYDVRMIFLNLICDISTLLNTY